DGVAVQRHRRRSPRLSWQGGPFRMSVVTPAAPRAARRGAREVLAVRGLTVEFLTAAGWVAVVRDVSFDLAAGEIVGLVGESGSGKSVTSLAVMGLIPSPPGRVVGGTIELDGVDLTSLSARAMEDL